MRGLAVLLALALTPAMAQDKPLPAPKKKPAAAKQAVHKKATPEQIRKFNALEKKKSTQPK